MDDMEDRPQEIRDFIPNSREVDRYIAKLEEQSWEDEELFTHAPRTKMDKKREKHLKKSRNGLQDLAENFYDDIKTLPFEDKSEEQMMGSSHGGSRIGRLKSEREDIKERKLGFLRKGVDNTTICKMEIGST